MSPILIPAWKQWEYDPFEQDQAEDIQYVTACLREGIYMGDLIGNHGITEDTVKEFMREFHEFLMKKGISTLRGEK